MNAFPDRSASFVGGAGFLSRAALPLDPNVGFTMSFWWVFDASGGANNLLLLGNIVQGVGVAGDQVRYAFENGLGVSRDLFFATDASFASNGGAGDHVGLPWVFTSIQYDPSTFPPNPTVRSSVNGLAFGTNTAMTALLRPTVAGTTFYVGNGPTGTPANWRFWPGRIDALAIHQGCLSLAEVQTLYNSGKGINLPGDVPAGSISKSLIAWYPFDEPSGSTVWSDYSGNGLHLAATGTVNSGNPRNS